MECRSQSAKGLCHRRFCLHYRPRRSSSGPPSDDAWQEATRSCGCSWIYRTGASGIIEQTPLPRFDESVFESTRRKEVGRLRQSQRWAGVSRGFVSYRFAPSLQIVRHSTSFLSHCISRCNELLHLITFVNVNHTYHTVLSRRYENLTPENVKTIESNGEVDAWVMALPNGGCTPFVRAIDKVQEERGQKSTGSVIVDLSADYRFECGENIPVNERWTYGLPGEIQRVPVI